MRPRQLIAGVGCVAVAAWAGQATAAGAPRTVFELPAGVLALSDSELPAGSNARLTFSVRIDRPLTHGRLALTLPRLWTQRSPVSGLAHARLPTRGRVSSARANVSRAARVVSFAFTGARKRDSGSFDVRDNGIPAGTYRLPYSWREGGRVRVRGTATVVFYAGQREP